MCWITLTPKPKHQHRHHIDHGSGVAELVRVLKKGDGPRYSKVRIVAPIHGPEKHYHHGHVHPLHMHPIHDTRGSKVHGSGKKRAPRCHLPSRSSSSCPSPGEPVYRTQIVEPASREVREVREVKDATRIALREVKPERGRLRRVAGYEVLGKDVPWDWDCVGSVASSGGKLRYPPFGSMDRWM